MYGNILTFLIAIVIQALAPRNAEATWTLSEVLHMVAYPVATWAVLRFRFRRLMGHALHDEAEARDLRASFTGILQQYQALLLVPFALLVYSTNYVSLVAEPAAEGSQVLGNTLGVMPYIVLLVALWWESYPLQGVLLGHSGSRARFVVAHARMELPVLLPWLALMGFLDLLRYLWPVGYAALERNALLQLLYAPVFLILVGIFLPILVKTAWGCEPIPAGPLRERLEQLCASLKLRVGALLFWPLLEGRVLTAGIVGLLPRFRYLLITPALASLLPPEEIDGVVAHEAGHVRHRHLWFYLLFFAGYVCLAAVFFRLTMAAVDWWGIADPRRLLQPRTDVVVSVATTGALLGLLVLYFRFLFGAVSRAFERQADAYALEVIGTPAPLVSALERISAYSGDIRDLPSWHHGSIADRVSFLVRAAEDPKLLRNHHRRVRRITGLFALGVAGLAALAIALHTAPLDRDLDLFVARRALLHRVDQDASDGSAWFALGNLYVEQGNEAGAEEAFREALRLMPQNPDVMNNLGWLYATARDRKLFRPERALALAEMAVLMKPAPYILDTLAEARYQVRDYAGAVQAIQAALAQRPQNMDYYMAQKRKFERALGGS